MNKAILMGRLTRDPDIRYTQSDTPMVVARFNLAVNRKYKNEDGGKEADFISCVCFEKTDEFFEKDGRQRVKFVIEVRIQMGNYTNKGGQKIYTTNVVVEDAEFAESKKIALEKRGEGREEPEDNNGFVDITDDIDETFN